ncbi:type VI secretion system-associated FHA domain protein TagH [Alphaproteobacteria bacterium KMM 3653]|uniref:Type VI secretion system-associated FHA domain protein TagH n=1 Tax=Harenicola maris TaxID=2841044 RepID=A0AAP2CNQ6_9RHOB|nr:type VI secretion system-associated FHA domain protein TagH [Harenicola maris]
MTLTLRIDNFNHLPDGGPVEYSVTNQGFEFGRDPGMDWTLPDPNRFVSSCHGEIRFENGGYVLVDVSTNGTFVNGSSSRVKSPYQLQDGDRLQVGHYLVLVSTSDGAAAAPGGFSSAPADPPPSGGGGDIWSLGGAAPASSASDFDPTPRGERLSDFGDQHIGLPEFGGGTPPPPGAGAPPPASSAADSGSPFDAPAEPPAATPPAASVEESASPFDPPAPVEPPQAPPVAQAPAAPEESASPFDPPSAAPTPPPQQAAPPAAPPPAAPTAPQSEAFPPPPPLEQTPRLPDTPPPKTGATTDASAFLRAICAGAGMPETALDGADAGVVANEIGKALRVTVTELAGLLRARAAAKQMVKSGSRTMLGREMNNPLKFIPTMEEALEVMFSEGRPGYMRGAEAVQSSFDDIKRHQYAMHAALQPAIGKLLQDLSPQAIEEKVEGGRFSSKSSKAWEIFVERWDAKTHPYDNGMLDVFLAYFAEAYDDVIEQS